MGSFIFCCILWLNDCWSKLHVLHLEYYWGWKAARTTKEQNFQAVFHICSTTQVCSKVIWGIQAVNSKWKREWHRYEKKKTKSEVFFIILDSFLQLYHCIAVIPQQNQGLQIVLEQLHSCSCALATWGNPGELREVDQRWFPTLAHWFQSEGAKDQNALGISYCFDYFVPHLWYSWSSIPWFFKNKETELPVFWMSEHISREKKKTNQNIAPRTARLKQFHPRFLWSYP